MSASKLNTLDPALLAARQAASQVVDDVDHLVFIDELPTGERTYQVFRTGLKTVTRVTDPRVTDPRVTDPTVTLSPDLATATVEWTRGKSKYGTGYRTFKIQGLVI